MLRRPGLRKLVLLGIALLGVGLLLWWNPARQEQDISQQRLDKASLALGPGFSLSQTFRPNHAGLNAIAFTLVKYERTQPIPADAQLTLTLERLDQLSAPLTVEVSVAGLVHNQEVRFEFPEQRDSSQAIYRFTLSTLGDYGLAAWHTLSDAYAGGELLVNGVSQPGDMRFSTLYAYHLRDMLTDILYQVGRWAGALPGLIIQLGLPGAALAPFLLPKRRLRWPVVSGYIITLSLSIWPLLLLWGSVVHVSLAGWHLAVIAVGFAGLALVGWRQRWRLLKAIPMERANTAEVMLAVILLATAATRLLQIRELVLPAWVDSLHHTVITQLLVNTGYVPANYQPFMPVGDFHYHFGFHASAAVLVWFSSLGSPQAVLLLGQVVNLLAPLGLYLLTTTITGKRWAGALSALIAGLVCYMPAYYTTWGRYTQLLGLFMLCGLASAFYEQISQDSARLSWRASLLSGMLLAGLAVSHYRVLVMAAVLAVVLLVVQLIRIRVREWRPLLLRVAVGIAISILLISPWIYRFMLQVLPSVNITYGGWEAVEGYNAFPFNLLADVVTKGLLVSSAAAVLWALVRRRWEIIVVAIWVGLCLLLANLHVLGLFDLWLLPNSAMVISFWLPVALFSGWLAADLVDWLPGAAQAIAAKRQITFTGYTALRRCPRYVAAAVCLVAIALGGWKMVDIINPVTILTTQEDLTAMEWIAANTPADARFLVNSRVWVNDLHVGSDAGWWIPLLTGRANTLPSVLYAQGAPAYVNEVRDLAQLVESSGSLDDPAVLQALHAAGVTHVYIGAKGGKITPAALDASRHFRLIYNYGATRIYALMP